MNGELFGVERNGLDYFAVYQPPRQKRGGYPSHLCNCEARDAKHALTIARNHGLGLRKGATASRIGREGYARQFGNMVETRKAVR